MGNSCRKNRDGADKRSLDRYTARINKGIKNVRCRCHMDTVADEYQKDLSKVMDMKGQVRLSALDELSYRIAMTLLTSVKQDGRGLGL